MKILIIGGLGYLGPVIAQQIKHYLKVNKLDVFDADWFSKNALLKDNLSYNNSFFGDKREINEELLVRYDIIIDLAAVSNDPMSNDFGKATLEINYKSSINIAKMCKKVGVKKYIFASSCSIYGSAGDKPRQEDDDKDPLTAYASSKYKTELELNKIANESFSCIALRFATACGWSPHFRADLVLNDFVVTALTNNEILVLSDGSPWRPLIHVNDIGRAVCWACLNQETGFDAYNVGSNEWTLTIADLANQVGKILNVSVKVANQNSVDNRSYRVNFDKFKSNAEGWYPQEDLNSTVTEMKNRLMPHIKSLKNFREGDLIRLNVLKKYISSKHFDINLRKINNEYR